METLVLNFFFFHHNVQFHSFYKRVLINEKRKNKRPKSKKIYKNNYKTWKKYMVVALIRKKQASIKIFQILKKKKT